MFFFFLAVIIAGISIASDWSKGSKTKSDGVKNQIQSYRFPEMRFWDEYKIRNPQKADEIISLGCDFSNLIDEDVKEKILSLERLAKGMQCNIAETKEYYINEIKKYPVELILQMIETTKYEKIREANAFSIKPDNTISSFMETWLQEYYDSEVNNEEKDFNNSINEEISNAKKYFPNYDEDDITEISRSLKEMSLLFKCGIGELKDFYIKDVKTKYNGNLEQFHYLDEAYKNMAYKAYELACRIGSKPENTSYGILCSWLDDIMKKERQKFIDENHIKCPKCRSNQITLTFYKDEYECKICKYIFK